MFSRVGEHDYVMEVTAGASRARAGGIARVPLLCEFGHFAGGLQCLRTLKDSSNRSAEEENRRYGKSANLAAKSLFNSQDRIFSDLRVCHASVTFLVYTGHGFPLESWVNIASGKTCPALGRRCSGVVGEVIHERQRRSWEGGGKEGDNEI